MRQVVVDMMRAVYEVGGKGHSCGIYSFDQDHIHRLGMAAPVLMGARYAMVQADLVVLAVLGLVLIGAAVRSRRVGAATRRVDEPVVS